VGAGSLEKLFDAAVAQLSTHIKFREEERQLLLRADQAAEELLESELESYISRKFNEQIPVVLSKHGLMGVPIAKRYGGAGAGALLQALVMERLGQTGMGVVTFTDVHEFLGSLTLQDWGSDWLKEQHLPLAASGKEILAYALTEPEAGSDPASMTTSYEKSGDGRYLIKGSKYLISNGSIATHMIVFARSKDTGLITSFLIDTKSKGFSVEMKLTEKPGLFTSDTALLSFDGLEVGREDILGEEGKGLHVAYSALLNGRIGIASGCVGVMEDCLNQVIERVKSRVQHGKEIGKHQLVQKHIAAIASNLESSRWLVYDAAMKKEVYDMNRQDRELRDQADRASAIAKYVASRCAFDTSDRALQLFGGFGYNTLSPVTKHFLDTRVARIYEGTDEIMELKIASSILGKDFEAYR
jgi:alkylation response protein AidB-like acyl-CoA dehydrogenase